MNKIIVCVKCQVLIFLTIFLTHSKQRKIKQTILALEIKLSLKLIIPLTVSCRIYREKSFISLSNLLCCIVYQRWLSIRILFILEFNMEVELELVYVNLFG